MVNPHIATPIRRIVIALLGACLGLALLGAAGAQAQTVTFSTPGCTAWTAPVGSSFQVKATGAQGAPGGSYIFPVTPEEVLNSGGLGGLGDVVSAPLSAVSTGTHLFVCVNVGGAPGGSSQGERRCEELRGFGGCFKGGAGGGASGVSLGGDFSQPLLVAGGGGGGGGLSPYGLGAPAYRGGAAGEAGTGGARTLPEPYAVYDEYFGHGGEAGSSSQAGAGGQEGVDGTNGAAGSDSNASGPGAGGRGGFGEFNGPCNSSPCEGGGGGGGGGGYHGGGGGGGGGIDGAGGGGGSSLVPAEGSVQLAAEAAQPEVQISYTPGPSAVTAPATGVAQTVATVNGSVNPNGAAISDCHFEYGTTESYSASVPCEPSPGSGSSPVAVSASLSELAPKTTYHFRVVATNEGATSLGADETFETLPNPPSVTGVSPDAGLQEGGTSVTITGAGFSEATSVKFGASDASAFTINSPTSITATAPAESAGTVDVTVANAGGTSATGAADQYTFVAKGHAPSITSLSAKKGPAEGGNAVTITGTGFVGVTAVDFGSTPATSVTVDSATSVTVVVPPASTGAVEVSVTTPNGESGATKKAKYSFGVPTVTGVSPKAGPIAGGTTVTITGSGFALGSATTFKFGKTVDHAVTCTSSTSCSVVSPTVSKKGAVDVTAVVGKAKSKKNAADRFTYN